jgi:hypothetical protein
VARVVPDEAEGTDPIETAEAAPGGPDDASDEDV